jgi:hypothetical protein
VPKNITLSRLWEWPNCRSGAVGLSGKLLLALASTIILGSEGFPGSYSLSCLDLPLGQIVDFQNYLRITVSFNYSC